MHNVLFSIIIPHYNSPFLLKKLLESIPDDPDVEVLVIDDRSDKFCEELKELIREYKNRGILFYENNTAGKGAGAARNVGLRHARGKWILFADADDYFMEGFYTALKEYETSEGDIVYFIPDSIDVDTGQRSDRHSTFEEKIQRYIHDPSKKNELIVRYTITSPCSKMIRHHIITENGIFFDETAVSNDNWFSTQIGFFARKIIVSDKKIYMITKGKDTITTRADKTALNIRMQNNLKQRIFLKHNLSSNDWKKLKLNADWLFVEAVYKGYANSLIMKWMLYYLIKGIIPVSFDGLEFMIKAERDRYGKRIRNRRRI